MLDLQNKDLPVLTLNLKLTSMDIDLNPGN